VVVLIVASLVFLQSFFERIKSVFTLQDAGAFVFFVVPDTREGIGRKGKMGGTVCWMNNYLNCSCFCNVFYLST
jgi:hypothetical protein